MPQCLNQKLYLIKLIYRVLVALETYLYQRSSCLQGSMDSRGGRKPNVLMEPGNRVDKFFSLCQKRLDSCWSFEERRLLKVCKDDFLLPQK